MLVSSDGDAAALLPAVRAAVRALDPEQPIYIVRTLETAVAEASFQQRIAAVLLAVFAGVALLLAAVGIFGVLSYSVSARTQEIGVRIAVGAEPSDVRWLVLRQVLVLTGTGLAIGAVVLAFTARLLEGLLFGVQPADPVTIALVAAVFGTVALAAAWVPALRATQSRSDSGAQDGLADRLSGSARPGPEARAPHESFQRMSCWHQGRLSLDERARTRGL